MKLFKKKNKVLSQYRVRINGWLYLIGDEIFTTNSEKSTVFSSMEAAYISSKLVHHDEDIVIIENKDGRVNFYNIEEAKEYLGI